MIIPSKEEIKQCLKAKRKEFPRDIVAEKIGVSMSMLNQCLSTKKMPESMRYEIAKLIGMISDSPQPQQLTIPDHIIQLEVAHEDHKRWAHLAVIDGKTVADWLTDTGNAHAEQLLRSQFNVVSSPEPTTTELLNEPEEPYRTSRTTKQ